MDPHLSASHLFLAVALSWAPAAFAQSTVVLYSNDFETPNTALVVNCGNSLDIRGINFLYGGPGFTYQQVNTVEGVVIDDPAGRYTDPSGTGGSYALGMLATYQDDLLALTFNAQGRRFLNVGLDLSPIDVFGCGGPFGTAVPIMEISLYDTPNGTFNFGAPGTLLARGTVTGTTAPTSSTFSWRYGTVGLDASAATTGTVTVMFNLLQSGYAAFDNLSIVASSTTGIVDRDTDQVADDADNCPDTPNRDQANADLDLAGDACDPAANDPTICGDIDQNGADDCTVPDAGVADDGGIGDAEAPDSGGIGDAAAPDSGAFDDAAALDSAPSDAGTVAADAQGQDAALPPDAGTGAPDAAARLDATTPRPDGGSSAADAGPAADDSGCGCTTTARSGSGEPVLALIALGALAAGRLRRRRPATLRRAPR
ncbi:MAG: hypothetical protein IT384_21725 [Deltaproteobacteria bacterium]|nr:hypothetical protein [Deltaproteobacteria bacterium]